MRRTKTPQIYKKTGNLRAVQLLLGHTKLESRVRYLGIEVDDALSAVQVAGHFRTMTRPNRTTPVVYQLWVHYRLASLVFRPTGRVLARQSALPETINQGELMYQSGREGSDTRSIDGLVLLSVKCSFEVPPMSAVRAPQMDW
jgi:hypothetical protein